MRQYYGAEGRGDGGPQREKTTAKLKRKNCHALGVRHAFVVHLAGAAVFGKVPVAARHKLRVAGAHHLLGRVRDRGSVRRKRLQGLVHNLLELGRV